MKNSLSKKISTARVICILSLIYVHFPPLYGEITDVNNFEDYFIMLVSNLIGRSSVPLLSIVSGYLIVTSISKYKYTRLLRNKMLTLLVPLVAWNFLSLTKDLMLGTSPLEDKNILNYLLSIYDTPGIMPLYFLRDIFVCVTLAFILLRLTSGVKSIITTFLLITLSIFDLNNYLFINDKIIIFFFLGMIIAKNKNFYIESFESKLMFTTSLILLIISTNLLIIIKPENLPDELLTIISITSRVFGAIIFWNIACFLTKKFNIGKYSSVIFFTFCSHTLIISFIWIIAKKLHIEPMTYSYVALFVSSPILVFIISLMIYKPFLRIFPKAQVLLTGKR
ncbi:acyltransferase [Shewanella sp. AC91-MNA-CIBAN-0169]|uniref:acyltransferase family protein n=1 Tax=Shewanella sp. AC91-MNA-CIBAN-0169 TaxID=3140466 RepID=UPI0033319A4B